MVQIFIGGTGRSGTTILKRVLTCHSKIIALQDELRVLVDPDGALDLIRALSDGWSPYNADVAIHRFRTLMLECARSNSSLGVLLEKAEKTIFRKLGISPRRYLGAGLVKSFRPNYYYQRLDQLIDELSDHITRGSWAGSPPYQLRSEIFETKPKRRDEVEKIVARFFHDLYRDGAAHTDQTHWLDDTPTNLLHVDDLLALFPNMRFIHIYRDPRDVIASYRRFTWGGSDLMVIAKRVANIYARWLEIREELPSQCFIEIRLETLSANPIPNLTKICEFVDLEFEQNLMQIPLNKVNAERWKRDIPAAEWAKIESELYEFIPLYGSRME